MINPSTNPNFSPAKHKRRHGAAFSLPALPDVLPGSTCELFAPGVRNLTSHVDPSPDASQECIRVCAKFCALGIAAADSDFYSCPQYHRQAHLGLSRVPRLAVWGHICWTTTTKKRATFGSNGFFLIQKLASFFPPCSSHHTFVTTSVHQYPAGRRLQHQQVSTAVVSLSGVGKGSLSHPLTVLSDPVLLVL